MSKDKTQKLKKTLQDFSDDIKYFKSTLQEQDLKLYLQKNKPEQKKSENPYCNQVKAKSIVQ